MGWENVVNFPSGDKRRKFSAIPGFILVGFVCHIQICSNSGIFLISHVQEVSNAGSLAECLKACLLAQTDYGFVCRSLMYYPTDQDQVNTY